MTSSPIETLESIEDAPGLAVRCVRALMERHGLPKYRGETLQVVTVDPVQGSVPGAMKVGSASLDCQLWLGEAVTNPRPDSLVAISTAAGWTAVLAGEATEGVAYKIERLEAKPSTTALKVIAVLDGDQDLTNSICAHFESSGYDARPFYKTADLASSAKTQRYDGFVIDWIVDETSRPQLRWLSLRAGKVQSEPRLDPSSLNSKLSLRSIRHRPSCPRPSTERSC